jgi:hypothetical protein
MTTILHNGNINSSVLTSGLQDATTCADRICKECGNDHGFINNFKDVRTIIDVLPELFPKFFKRKESLN